MTSSLLSSCALLNCLGIQAFPQTCDLCVFYVLLMVFLLASIQTSDLCVLPPCFSTDLWPVCSWSILLMFFFHASRQTWDLFVLDQFYWCSSSMSLHRPVTCVFLINSTDILLPCLFTDLWPECFWSILLMFFHVSPQTWDLCVLDQFYWYFSSIPPSQAIQHHLSLSTSPSSPLIIPIVTIFSNAYLFIIWLKNTVCLFFFIVALEMWLFFCFVF